LANFDSLGYGYAACKGCLA